MESVFWIVSKIAWALIAPETLLLFLMILSAVLLWTRYNKQGRILISSTVLIVAMVSILPFSYWILGPLEDRFPVPKKLPDRVDGIIVLAGAEDISVTAARDQPSPLLLLARFLVRLVLNQSEFDMNQTLRILWRML